MTRPQLVRFSQEETDIVYDGFCTARAGGFPGECPYTDYTRHQAWLDGFLAWVNRREGRKFLTVVPSEQSSANG